MPKSNRARLTFADPFCLITNPVPVQVITFEPSLEQTADECIAMLVEKLAEQEAEIRKLKTALEDTERDSQRLQWLESRLDTLPGGVDVCEKIFGYSTWTQIRNAFDYAMSDGK